MGKIIIFTVIVVVLIFVILDIVAEYAFKKAFLRKRKNKEESFKILNNLKINISDNHKDIEENIIEIYSKEGFLLKGHLVEPIKDGKKYIILVHGYTANYYYYIPYINFYKRLGYNVLLVETRAHGNSEGKYCTYGYYEKDDLNRWIEYLDNKYENLEIGLHGQSMGGATVLLTGVENPRVKFVIDDCGYTDGKEIIKYQIGKKKWVPFSLVYFLLDIKAKRRCGFKFEEVSPREEVLKSKVPVMFIHGDKDETVPVEMSIDLYNERKNPLDDLLIVKGAIHLGAYGMDKEEYEKRVANFIIKVEKI